MQTRRELIQDAAAWMGAALCGDLAWGQTGEKKLRFEVASIRPTAGNAMKGYRWAPSPDGYRTEGQTIWATIMIAYFPLGVRYWRNDRLIGAPKWAIDDAYDIEGRVSAEDVAEWQKQTPMQHEMLNAMLRTLLEDRCKLVLRQTTVDAPIFALQVAHGGRLKESVPGAVMPQGFKLAGGGVMVGYKRGEEPKTMFYGATMADLATHLSGGGGDRVVQDRTGLTGKYDFVLRKREAGADAAEDQEPALAYDLDALGLTLKGAKAPSVVLVIDHIERPTAN